MTHSLCTVTLTKSDARSAAGTLEGHPAQPPYTVVATLDAEGLVVVVSGQRGEVGHGILEYFPEQPGPEPEPAKWHGEVKMDGANWLCRGVAKSLVLEFCNPVVPWAEGRFGWCLDQ